MLGASPQTSLENERKERKTVIEFSERLLKNCDVPVTIGDYTLTKVAIDEDPCNVGYSTNGNTTVLGLWPGKLKVEINYFDNCGPCH